MRNEDVETIRAACVKANPEIAADTRSQRQETLDFAYDDFLIICKEIAKEESGRTWVGAAIAFDRVKKLSAYAAMFQDRPFRLADVLLAIHTKTAANKTLVTLECDGQFVEHWFNFSRKKSRLGPTWDLRVDDLTQQSDETLEFLARLLTV